MNKVVLVTGAAGNLGGAVARKFINEGWIVIGLVSNNLGKQFNESKNLHFFSADLRNEQETSNIIEKVAKEFGRIDLAVLTVGGFGMGTLDKTTLTEMEKMLQLNFSTAYNKTRSVFKIMKSSGTGGKIIFIGARPGIQLSQAADMVAYGISKSAILSLAKVINASGKEFNILAHVVVPSIIDTPQNRSSMPEADFTKWVSMDQIAENIYHLNTESGKSVNNIILKIYGQS